MQIKSTEDLLTLTRAIRELWAVGPLKAPGAHDAEAEARMRADAEHVFALLNTLRDAERQDLAQALSAAAPAGGAGGAATAGGGSGFTFERAEVDTAVPPLAQVQGQAAGTGDPAGPAAAADGGGGAQAPGQGEGQGVAGAQAPHG